MTCVSLSNLILTRKTFPVLQSPLRASKFRNLAIGELKGRISNFLSQVGFDEHFKHTRSWIRMDWAGIFFTERPTIDLYRIENAHLIKKLNKKRNKEENIKNILRLISLKVLNFLAFLYMRLCKSYEFTITSWHYLS